MPQKGFFTQSLCLLTDGRTTVADVKSAVTAAGFHSARDATPSKEKVMGGPGFLIPYRPELNGIVHVDLLDITWPDGMGDPKSDPMTFAAWSMGQFGPFTFPGSLSRAIEHAWGWQDARKIVPTHQGVIRLRCSYVGGASPDSLVIPLDYEPVSELLFLTRLMLAAGNAPGVLCCFNPNGETLSDLPGFRSFFEECVKQNKEPLFLWANARLFALTADLSIMDTVGNGQLDIQDIEVIFPTRQYEPKVIDYYMRNVTHYLLDLGREIKTGESIDGPNETNLSWTAQSLENGVGAPPRRVLRLFPKAQEKAIRQALHAAGIESK